MKALKVKSIFFSLIAVMSVAVFMTSCEQTEEIIGGDDSGLLVVEDGSEVYDLADLPEDPEVVLANSMIEDANQELEDRVPCNKVVRLKKGIVDWYGSRTLALWIYHYNSSGNYIGYTRRDSPHSSCKWNCRTWSYNNSIARSVAFVGYQSNGTYAVNW